MSVAALVSVSAAGQAGAAHRAEQKSPTSLFHAASAPAAHAPPLTQQLQQTKPHHPAAQNFAENIDAAAPPAPPAEPTPSSFSPQSLVADALSATLSAHTFGLL